jgi:small-conductance mechanosensitive channel
VKRPLGYVALLVAAGFGVTATLVDRVGVAGTLYQFTVETLLVKGLLAIGLTLGFYGLYLVVSNAVGRWIADKRRRHDVRNLLRLVFVLTGAVAVLGVATDQWVGVLFSLGVVGFAVTFALQQPLFSLIGWVYIMAKRPYQVGDRVAIEDSKGDVVEVDFLVTTLWEIEGDLVSTHQPSGRTVTMPNSVVLSSHVRNYTRDEFPYVWNEVAVQVSFETDLAFAREQMIEEAGDVIGTTMRENVRRYREQLAETPVELDVNEAPTVNVHQKESWIELRLRYLVDPRRQQATRNELYEGILARLNEHPDRVSFPVGRFR